MFEQCSPSNPFAKDTASKLQELGELFSVKVTIEADKRNAMLVGGKDNVRSITCFLFDDYSLFFVRS
jgi:hypothetical protein